MNKKSPIAMPDISNGSGLFSASTTINVKDDEFKSIRDARVRIFAGILVFGFMLFLLITRLAEVTMFRAPSMSFGVASNEIKHRADILDRNGELLATTLETYSLSADPGKVWDPVASTEAITSVLPDLDAALVEERLSSNKGFVWIRRNLTPRERQLVFSLGLPELTFWIEPRRVYPRERLAAHVLGFTDIDMNGTAGAERAFDLALSDKNTDAKHLSIDMRVQYALDDELRSGMAHFKAKAAAGVVMNIKNGEILGMISLPDFDPNQSGKALPENRLNRASMSVYELGSTFKPINIALAYEAGVIREGEKLPVQNKIVIQRKSIKDDHPSNVPLSIPDVLAESSNRGSVILARRAGAEAQQTLLRNLGLFDKVPFELAESAKPLLPREWQDITTATVSYGHGLSVTPLALATALATVLNGGVYIQPTIEKRPGGVQPVGRRVISTETSQKLVDMMRYVVTDGTGRNARVSGYGLMGKTGTADKLVNGKYALRTVVTSFVGAFPHSDPTYLVYIMYDEPQAVKGTYGYATAGWNAAKTSGKIVERIAPILGVKRRIQTTENANSGTKVGGRQ
ncbi:MAG: penicillin-binding protein 2 [Acidimicrobiales bacterium]|nr:penicillin-binding protein 2 [Hyphomonadaceae bacterium]RZV40722.1 MAG: penicillin-binding protein 2 [Acidimicrobiales bacterium]